MSGDVPESCAQDAVGAVLAYIGLGSNLDNPLHQIARAFAALETLPDSRCLARSSLYCSRPLGDEAQPDYINAVVLLETRLPAHALLQALLAVEDRQGRTRRTGDRWMSRTLDLDLLLYGEQEYSDAQLTIPHPELVRRDFVLYPMFEITPELLIPGAGRLRDCLQRCPQRGLQRVESHGETAAS